MAVSPQWQRPITPDENRITSAVKITQTQRQALIDNLQLEITERARKLRAQYALQSQSLRARLEMRVNRIPMSLRKRSLQDLLDEHTHRSRPATAPPIKLTATTQRHIAPTATITSPRRQQSLKRKSDRMEDDKENEAAQPANSTIDNPKKRSKTVQANSKATRTNAPAGNGVLSPRSHNSQTMSRSPVKPASTMERLGLSRTTSPLKALKKAISKPNLQTSSKQAGKRAVKDENRSSGGSESSNVTTIIKRPATKKNATTTTTTKKAATTKTTATSRKTTAAVKETVSATGPTTSSSGRTLRKRT